MGCLSSFLSCLGLSPFGPCGGCIETVYQDASFFFLFCIYDNVISKAEVVISRPPMLTLPSWSSNASHMLLSRKMLKRVGQSKHPCQTPTVVLNHSLVLPLNRTALWALSYRFSMVCMMLAWMLYFLIVAYEDMVEFLLMLQVFLAEDPEIEYLFCGAPFGSETCLLFCNDLFCLWPESV